MSHYVHAVVEVRGSPYGLVYPWARWVQGPVQIPEFKLLSRRSQINSMTFSYLDIRNRAAPRGRIGALPPIRRAGNIHIRGRDSPQGVFDPWVRWDLGLDRIRSFRVVVVVVVVVVGVVMTAFVF